ncbi:MAG TPA: sialidase family protein [Longimicrobiales bacterium]|nr:sialidase family protein [Longimicrobiales bacterium]
MSTATSMRRSAAALAACVALVASACANEPATIEDASLVAAGNAHSPTVAVAADGATYVAWVSGDSTFDVLLARAGEQPVRVNDIAGDAAPHAQAPAQVALGPEGNVYVAWQNNTPIEGRRFPASDLRFARSADGGRTFEPAIHVNDDAGGVPASHTFHDVAVGDDGTVYVSWIDGRVRAQAESPRHADAPAHEHGDSDTGPEIRVARSRDGGRSFGPGVVVTPKACPCCRTTLAVSGRNVYVAWRDVTDDNVRNIVVAHSADGGETWSAPRAVHQDAWQIDGCPHAGPSLAIGRDGRLHVAWYTGAPDRPGIYHAVADDGLHFGAPAPLLSGEWVPPSLVELAATDGAMLAAWDDRRSEVPRLTLERLADGAQSAGFRARGRAHSETAGLAPALAANGGRYALAWLRGDSVYVRLGALP